MRPGVGPKITKIMLIFGVLRSSVHVIVRNTSWITERLSSQHIPSWPQQCFISSICQRLWSGLRHSKQAAKSSFKVETGWKDSKKGKKIPHVAKFKYFCFDLRTHLHWFDEGHMLVQQLRRHQSLQVLYIENWSTFVDIPSANLSTVLSVKSNLWASHQNFALYEPVMCGSIKFGRLCCLAL